MPRKVRHPHRRVTATAKAASRQGSRGVRSTTLPAAERRLEEFLTEVAGAIVMCMGARHWKDLEHRIDAYAAQVKVEPTLLFHSAMVCRVLQHALTLRDAQPFWEYMTVAHFEVERKRSGAHFTTAVEAYRRSLEERHALEAFEQLAADDGSVN